ncbi:MAG: four helix bundle protein [Actinomycetia bacterium]|nr:four helix bundle protein [Actinomycetes bacterium]
MSDYKKLKVWEDAHKFTVDIYNITQKFPNNEQYGLTSQIRRSSSSIPTNIVEGSGQLDNGNLIRFLGIAKGSAFETEYQLLLAKDLKYINEKDYDELNEKIQKIISMLTNLIKSLRSKRKTNKK